MFEIRKYNDADKEVWNAYVEHATQRHLPSQPLLHGLSQRPFP